jgi:hypothetical protein
MAIIIITITIIIITATISMIIISIPRPPLPLLCMFVCLYAPWRVGRGVPVLKKSNPERNRHHHLKKKRRLNMRSLNKSTARFALHYFGSNQCGIVWT